MEEWAVTIQLRSRQTLDGETAELEQRTEGTLSTDGRVWCLRYREPGEEGGETSLTLRAGEAVLERAGSLATRLRFRTGAVCPGRLEMPACPPRGRAWGASRCSCESVRRRVPGQIHKE